MNQLKSGSKKIRIKIYRIAALLTGAAFLFYACENKIEMIKPFTGIENLPVMEAKDVETMFTDSGEMRFFMKAPKRLIFETPESSWVEFPEGIHMIRYNQDKEIISSITADYAKQFNKEKRWEAKNNVIATNARGDTLKTEHLIWDEQTEEIYTEEFVKIIREDQIITGIGFHSDQSLQNWRIKNPKGTIYVNTEKSNTGNNPGADQSPSENRSGPELNEPADIEN